MGTKLITLILRVVEAGDIWMSWLTVLTFCVVAGTIILCRERARRQTYKEVLKIIRPGTYFSDQTKRRSRLTVVCIPGSASPQVSVTRQTIEGRRK